MIQMIVATTPSGVIGLKGTSRLLWDSEVDMRFFKDMTQGKVVVMGNSTYKTLGKPLKNRTNVVLSKTQKPGKRNNGVIYFNNMQDILKTYPSFMVIGGESIYEMFLPIVDEVFWTSVSLEPDDNSNCAYFPLDVLDNEFYLTTESDPIQDVDRISKLSINLIFTHWARDRGNLH